MRMTGNTFTPRRIGWVCAGVLLAGLLGGCDQEEKQSAITAVYLGDGYHLVDGHPMAVFASCGGSGVFGIHLSVKAQGTPAPSASSANLKWDVRGNGAVHDGDQMLLLKTPPGWVLTTTIDDLMEGMDEQVEYHVKADTAQGQRPDAGVSFTLAGLRGLAPGQVLAVKKAADGPVQMSTAEFHEAAAKSCE